MFVTNICGWGVAIDVGDVNCQQQTKFVTNTLSLQHRSPTSMLPCYIVEYILLKPTQVLSSTEIEKHTMKMAFS